MPNTLKDYFAGFYPPTPEELKEKWKTATFILDTNVLLGTYRFPIKARDDFFNVLSKFKDRIWIPNYVALEYERNRLSVIADQKKRFTQVKSMIEESKSKLISALNGLQLEKRHSSIKVTPLLKDINKATNKFFKTLQTLEEKQMSVLDHDNIRDKINELLTDKIGKAPKDQSELNEIYKEGEKRYSNEYPPGFEDIKKDRFMYSGLEYDRKYGDLIIWKQIIQKAKESSLESIIFVTEEKKRDWWWIIDSEGEKKIGPRPELVEEIKRETSVSLFHLYKLAQFLEYSKEYLQIEVEDESIEEIRDVMSSHDAISSQSKIFHFEQYDSESARFIIDWLMKQFPGSTLSFQAFPSPEIIIHHGNKIVGCQILNFTSHSTASMDVTFIELKKLSDIFLAEATKQIDALKLDEYIFLIVFRNEVSAFSSLDIFRTIIRLIPPRIKLIIGTCRANKDDTITFEPRWEFTRDTKYYGQTPL